MIAAGIIARIVQGALALGALWLLWRSIRKGRGHDAPRCPKCGYDLRGAPGVGDGFAAERASADAVVCPECGRAARSARSLYRHRWRRRVRLGAIGALAAALCVWTPRVEDAARNGWLRLIPDALLIRMTRLDWSTFAPLLWRSPPPKTLRDELQRRYLAKELSARATYVTVRRLVESAPNDHIVFPRWGLPEAPLRTRHLSMWALPEAQIDVSTEGNTAHDTVMLSPGWITTHAPAYADRQLFRINARGPETTLVQRWRVHTPHGWMTLPARRSTMRVRATLDEAIPPVRSLELDAMMRDHFTFACSVFQFSVNDRTRLEVTPPSNAPSDVTWGLKIVVCYDGRVVANASVCVRNGATQPIVPWNIVDLDGNPPTSENRAFEPERWTLVVRDDPKMAMEDFDATRRWVGEVVMPIDRFQVTWHGPPSQNTPTPP